ncbi:MAG: glycosyltransferase family 4 protein [Lentisphaeria bacterium]|nr:glycosyltransferase family 4 protein [Lentisphaeria bacterium]
MSCRKLKIFISAYACEPEKGSEPGIGWNVVNELARYHEVHVLTRANNRESIESALAGRTEAVPCFHYYDLPGHLAFWKKKRRGYRLYYYLWQYGAFLHYRKWVDSFGFDLVQHLTFANFAMPSLFMMCKPVTVYGPIGKIPVPDAIFGALPFKVKVRERLREWTMNLLCRLEPMRLLTPRFADRILECGVAPGESSFPAKWRSKIRNHPQTGINTAEPEYRTERKRNTDETVRLLICSEFLHWKGVVFAAEVFSRIARRRNDVELLIYGSGPEEEAMRSIFRRNHVEHAVQWKGFVDKREMIQALFDADILLYPSYHHGLATVILQAMYARLPIVALTGDPIGLAVSEGAGLAASGASMPEILDDLERKTEQLIGSRTLREELGANGRRLIEIRYEWRVLVRQLSALLTEMVKK